MRAVGVRGDDVAGLEAVAQGVDRPGVVEQREVVVRESARHPRRRPPTRPGSRPAAISSRTASGVSARPAQSSSSVARSATRGSYDVGRGHPPRQRARQGVRRARAVHGRLVPPDARAAAGPRRPQRRRQDDAPAHPRRRDRRRRRRDRALAQRAHGAARPAAAALVGPHARGVRRRVAGRRARRRGAPGGARGPHGRRRARRRHAARLRDARRRRWRPPAATSGARASSPSCAASASRDADLGAAARHVLRRRAHPRLAGPRAGRAARRAAARRAHQPPRPRVARVARARGAVARRLRAARLARPLVPGVGGDRRAGARARPRQGLRHGLLRLPPREGAAARDAGRGASSASRRRSQRLERFVDKFRAGTRARQAKSVEKRLGAHRARRAAARREVARVRLPQDRRGRAASCWRRTACAWWRARSTLVEDASFALERGAARRRDRAQRLGQDDADRDAAGPPRPAAGRVKLGHNAEVAYFSQHVEELPENATVLEAMCLGTALNQGQARNLLGRFLFGGDTVERRVGVLSGGERRRLSLARLVASGANMLVLDEPTNHLDVESREALEDALDAFDGTILFVSHDRALIDAVADETLSVERHRLVLRAGRLQRLPRRRRGRAAARRRSRRSRGPSRRRARPRRGRRRSRDRRRAGPRSASCAASASSRSGSRRSRRRSPASSVDLADPAVATDRDLVSHAAAEHRGEAGGADLAHARVGRGERDG